MRASLWAALLFAVVLAPAPPPAWCAADPVAADAAFDAGENAKALELYDAVLAERPGDVHALLRSGMLLSWDRKYDDALDRYERALSRDPDNERVLLERGKVQLWSGKYDDAVGSFRRVLDQSPNEPWALLGTAQAFAWRGRNAEARPYFERAYAADPTLKDARLGLARAELETGDTGAALEHAIALEAAYPDDPEVKDFAADVRRRRAPWVQVGFDHLADSDENHMNTYRAEGGFSLPARLDLRLGALHADLHGPVPGNLDADGEADWVYGALGWQPKPRHRGELRVGAMKLTDSASNERTMATGGLAYEFPMAGWTGRAAAAYDPLLYSPDILDNQIDVAAFSFYAGGRISPRLRFEGNAGYGDFSDGNARISADAGAWYVWSWPTRSLLLGGVVRYLTFSDDVSHGYFDPSDLTAVLASLRSFGAIRDSKWDYEVAAEAGVQRYTFNGEDNTGKPLWNVYGLVARPLPRGFSFQLYVSYGNSSAGGTGDDFHSIGFGARLRWAIGG
jgi:tetratricopeptide (TPR) repeat protein